MGEAMRVFRDAGIEVLAPELTAVVREDDGFLFFRGEEQSDPQLIELLYLHNLRKLGPNGFSYFVNPHGYIGKSVSYELGIAHAMNVPCFFAERPSDHPAYVDRKSIWSPYDLVTYLQERRKLPPLVEQSAITQLWKKLVVPGSVISAGAILEYSNGGEPEVMLVRTHKWQHQFSIVGGKVRHRERLADALRRTVMTETSLEGAIGRHICTFDEIQHAGYYGSAIQRVFVDNVVRVSRKRAVLNDDAQEYL